MTQEADGGSGAGGAPARALAVHLRAHFGADRQVEWLGGDRQLAILAAGPGVSLGPLPGGRGGSPPAPASRAPSGTVLAGIDALPREEVLGVLLAAGRRVAGDGLLAVLLSRPPGELLLLLETAGFAVERTEQAADRWLVLAQRADGGPFQGLSRIQSILAFDRKSATYKFALVRALVRIGRTEPHAVLWRDGLVHVPLRSLAVAWLRLFWPLVTGPAFVAQLRGERAEGTKSLGIRRQVEGLAARYGAGGLPLLLADLDADPGLIDRELRAIAETIRTQPVRYANTGGDPLFGFRRELDGRPDRFGWVAVPEEVWLDLVRFGHWIEDSVIVRWAELSAEMNPALSAAEILPLLMDPAEDLRDTGEVRAAVPAIAAALGHGVTCAWTGQPLRSFEIDHVLPYSVWRNNDLWNLLPAAPAVNGQKRDRLPSHGLLVARERDIRAYWRAYGTLWGARFATQVGRALGADASAAEWDARAYAGLVEAVERSAATRGLPRWEP